VAIALADGDVRTVKVDDHHPWIEADAGPPPRYAHPRNGGH
jgi:hypothetical protein